MIDICNKRYYTFVMLIIKDFTIEYKSNPLGIDEKTPRFSWKLISDRRGVKQRSYRLLVYNGETAVWDSGIIKSDKSILIPYEGLVFSAQTEYRAVVEITDNQGGNAAAELHFETGLLCGTAFDGAFIAPDIKEQPHVWTVEKTLTVSKEVKKARLYATALGMYRADINGKKVGDLFFAPFWTSYNKVLQYQTYDVTEAVTNGQNQLLFTVAKGWYRGEIGWDKNKFGDTSAVMAELHIFYADGTKEIIATDKSWSARQSYITDSEIYHGETQDFTAGLSAIYPVKEVTYDKNKIVSQINEPCRVIEKLKPIEYLITPLGEHVLDFGQNLTGLVELTLSGKSGQRIELSHAEILNPDGNFYTANLRAAKATDIFILAGGEQTLLAEFTFHGFRYLKVTGIDTINPNDFTALVIHSDLKKAGSIVTDDTEVNRFMLNVEWGQRGNFVDVPTDCPQRDERLGWTGDANAFFRTAAYQYNSALFFKKWLNDLRLDQTADGSIPFVIPDVGIGTGFDALWADATTMIPYDFYKVYGDKKILEAQYPSMKKYVEGISAQCCDGDLVVRGHQFGDWVALDKDEFMDGFTGLTDVYFLANAFYIISLRVVINAAKILGLTDDTECYGKKLKAVQKAFTKEYITAGGKIVSQTQTAYGIALHFDLIPDKFRPKIISELKENLTRRNWKLTTGFIGAPLLCFVLADNGLREECEKILLSKEYPGWLYPVTRGATTVWERWNGIKQDGQLYPPDMNSFNHYAYGSVKEFYFRRIAGIDCLEPGFKKIIIKPAPVKGLNLVKAEYDSVCGVVKSEYERIDGKIHYKIEIPANTTARIILPGEKAINVGSGIYEFDRSVE